MLIHFNPNHLLAIENENIPQLKAYTYTAGGYTFSGYDEGMIVAHKKDIKIVNLKNLGDGMNVIYLVTEKNRLSTIAGSTTDEAVKLFHGFDEVSGDSYFFVPNVKEQELVDITTKLEKLQKSYTLHKTDKGICVQGKLDDKPVQNIVDQLQFLFDLVVMYGKVESKADELLSLKIQIPLFGQYSKHQETLDQIIQELQSAAYFFKVDKLNNKNGITYQISCNDYEVLELFAHRYEAIAKFKEISKSTFTHEMKEKVINFLETNPEIPNEGKQEVIKAIKTGKIKLLQK